jgi:signal transduction histidine kinase
VDRRLTTWWRWWRNSPARDAVFAVVVTVVLLAGTWGEAHPGSVSNRSQFPAHLAPHPRPAAYLLVVVACMALAWRRRRPVAVLVVSTAAVTAWTLLGYVNGAVLLAPIVALYAVATRVSVRRAIALGVATLAVLMTATAARNPFGHITGGGFYLIPAMVAAALFGGIAVASRRAYVASVEARAEDAAQRRIDEERLRIARELHDVVAHTMATINVQAGAAIHVAEERPGAAVDALRTIRGASKEGLRELRAILNVLRQADEADSTVPAPGLAQIDDLIASARSAGLATTLTVTGNRRPLSPEIDLTAYRIVQESLTNVIRHAGPAAATVSIGYTRNELRIEVADTGQGVTGTGSPGAKSTGTNSTGTNSTGTNSTGTDGTGTDGTGTDGTGTDGTCIDGTGGGHGLAGMRERATSVGGSVEAGPRAGGGFLVAARLPLGSQPPPADRAESTPVREGTRS